MKPLTDKQERFVHEYLIDQNASAAAERAGYSPKTKGTQATELMKLPQVKARILQELSDLYARLKVNALDLLRAQVAAAYFDPAKLFDEAQEPVPLHQLDEETRAALTVSYDRRRNGEYVMRVRQTPRHVAVAALNRRLDQFEKIKAGFEDERPTAHRQAECDARNEAARPAAARPIVLDIEAYPPQSVAAAPGLAQAHADIAAAAEALAQAASGEVKAPEAHASSNIDLALLEIAPPIEVNVPVEQAPQSAKPPVRLSAFAEEMAKGRTPPPAASAAPAVPANYNFRDDPNWMWGGAYRRNPVPPQELPTAEQIAEAVVAAKLRPRHVIRPTGYPPGYNPRPPRDGRPEFAIGAGEFRWS